MSNILKVIDFTEFPGPRYISLGPNSGEEFREKYLIPRLNEDSELIVSLDGAYGYGSSFLEEAFGGLVRKGLSPDVVTRLGNELISEEDLSLKIEVQEYIQDAIEAL